MKLDFKRKTDFLIEPEEILLENNVQGAKRLEFSLERRFIFLFFGLILGFIFLALFLVLKFQFFSQDIYAKQAEENSLRRIFVEAPRGIILDRFGKILAENETYFEVVFVKESASANIENELEIVSRIFNLEKSELQQKISRGQFSLIQKASVDKAIEFKANESLLPSFKIIGRYARSYPYGESLSHVIGYTALVTQEDLEFDPDLFVDETIGKSGVELEYDKYLRGRKGKLDYFVNVKNDLISKTESSYFEAGNNLRLTIDIELQEKIYQVFSDSVKDQKSGAVAVAINPQNGEILSLVSYPGFDFANSKTLLSKANPFFNRVLNGEYSPGSTIKPFVALAALEEKIIDPLRKISDEGGRIVVENQYFPDRPYIFRDWTIHGEEDMESAIADSCNVYFYTIGGGHGGIKGLGVEKINEYLRRYGWGEKTGVDFGSEKSGFLPTPQWKKDNFKDDWRIGDTYLYSIGQGYVRSTPIQLTSSYQLFANRGKIFKPYLVSSIDKADDNENIFLAQKEIQKELQIDQSFFDVINNGMERTAIDGSAAGRLSDLPFPVIGKTGSIQTSGSLTETNAAFISFIPKDNPEFLLLVLVESGGSGGATAVPLAKQILYWYWENRLLK